MDNITFYNTHKFDIKHFTNNIRSPLFLNLLTEFLTNNYKNIFNSDNKKINEKIKYIINLLNLNISTNEIYSIEDLYNYIIKNCLKYKKINIFNIEDNYSYTILKKLELINKKIKFDINLDLIITKPTTLSSEYKINTLSNEYKSNTFYSKYKSNVDYKITNNLNTINYKYILFDNNFFNFDKIINISKEYNNNVNFINLKFDWRLRILSKNTRQYTIYIFLNFLYLIFCMQSINGDLLIYNMISPNNCFLEYIYSQ